jgi:hypothetical protein
MAVNVSLSKNQFQVKDIVYISIYPVVVVNLKMRENSKGF